MAKKLLSFGILLVFSFLMAGHFLAYELLLRDNRNTMTEYIKSGSRVKELVTIKLSKSEANGQIDGDEITFKNHRYDIVSIEDHGKTMVVHALNDATEERLIAGLNDNYDNIITKKTSSHKNTFYLLNDFFKEYAPRSQVTLIQNPASKFQSFQVPLFSDKLREGYYNCLAQPPKSEIA